MRRMLGDHQLQMLDFDLGRGQLGAQSRDQLAVCRSDGIALAVTPSVRPSAATLSGH